jgi:CBS domain-containing protein
MTPNVIRLEASSSAQEAARAMREHDIGDVVVERDDRVCGIVTDRDLVVRCLADGEEGLAREIGSLCSRDLVTLDPDSGLDDAIALMEDKAIRRIPILKRGHPIGIVSLGDLAVARQRQSALGKVSDAPANH